MTALQTFLFNQYSNFYQSNITGYFGLITEKAVQQWQKEHAIVSSGSPATTGYGAVGPKTRTAMQRACSQSAVSN